jgi:hypothetical protein
MNRSTTCLLLGLVIVVLSAEPSQATVAKSGSVCAKIHEIVKAGPVQLQCVKIGSKQVWKPISIPKTGSSARPIATGMSEQSISSTLPTTVEILRSPIVNGFSASSGLSVKGSTSTPENCGFNAGTLVLLRSGKCAITLTQPGDSKFAPATGLSSTIEITKPKLKVVDDQIDAATNVTLVPFGQVYVAELFELSLLKVTDNMDAILCADGATNTACKKTDAGQVIVDPAATGRTVKFHFRLKNTSTEIMPPTFYFRLLINGQIYEDFTSVTLPILNDFALEPGTTVESDFYAYLPKSLDVSTGYLLFDESFVSVDQAILFSF